MLDKKRFLPEFRRIVDTLPKMDTSVPVELIRQVPLPSGLSNPPLVDFWDETFNNGDIRLRMRFYRSKENLDKNPGLLYWTHGGGMSIGTPEMDDGMFERFATEAGLIIASIEYRLAPEHPYPIPLEDCYTGLVWLANNAKRLGFDENQIAIGGASAGGNLAISTALMARDKGGPNIFFQMPLCPMLNYKNNAPANEEFTEDAIPFSWNREANAFAWNQYLGNLERDKVPYYASPALAEDLRGLPKTYIAVGELDVFRDENLDFVMRLCQAAVDVEFHLYHGVFHGFEQYGLPSTKKVIDEYVRVLKEAFAEGQ
ncbi:alpha/beta hydrolase [Muricomes intestini]|jgi:acetyl esterase/lipase|uniref:alpha/beta hydrolase n=1 Tax=Muricomes intestini TaxID=1796634 RepID=UPI002FE31C53